MSNATHGIPTAQAEPVFVNSSSLGEGSLWDSGQERLHWVDILENKLFTFNPSDRTCEIFDTGENVTAVALARNGALLLALRSGFAVLDGRTKTLSRLGVLEDRPGYRFNDGKCDAQGRFWAGTMVEQGEPGSASLYCLESDLSVSRKLDGVTISNGMAWSLSGDTFYYIDTPTRCISAFDFSQQGSISQRRIISRIPDELGLPDGMTIDNEGQLWIALWGGGKVIRLDPRLNRVTFEVTVAAKNVTCCAFGGRGLQELYITTARVGMTGEEQARLPLAGSLFCVSLPFQGIPSTLFAGDLKFPVD